MHESRRSKHCIRLGARGSLLSRMQSATIARQIEALCPDIQVELVTIATSGDRIQDRPLYEFGGKGLFTKELEQALLQGAVDFAVHSLKDVPVTMPLVDTAELIIAATPAREDARDVLISLRARSIADLPVAARVGTGSLRRQAQLLDLRPDLSVQPIRGNVDTRLAKLKAGDYDAVILAMAGLKRAGLFDPSLMTPMEPEILLPAAGQGALALQCRRSDAPVRDILAPLNDPASALCVHLERTVIQELNGDCHSPIAAYSTLDSNRVTLWAAVAGRGGSPPILRASASADVAEAQSAAAEVIARLKSLGAAALLGT